MATFGRFRHQALMDAFIKRNNNTKFWAVWTRGSNVCAENNIKSARC